ncbi:hypothetical protein [Xenorhabdus mauleonii]|uniref:hypothetical protein n=1 Tax=Xenorhabdus mauleonii TaxID=351675 RepID=UPI00147451C4|nr:hypothetical protein [Xenorhabdus mauleonii]
MLHSLWLWLQNHQFDQRAKSYSQQQLTPMRTSLTNAIFSFALSQLQGDTVDAHSPSNPKRPDALFALERQFCLMNALQCSALFGNGRTAGARSAGAGGIEPASGAPATLRITGVSD